MEETKLTTESSETNSELYNQIYGVYSSMGFGQKAAEQSDPMTDLANILAINQESSKVATYMAWDIFNARGRQRSSTSVYAAKNYFEDSSERKARKLIIESLNNYIHHLQGLRYGYNKVASLYSFLISKGLFELLSDLYIPEDMKGTIDYMAKSISESSDNIIKNIQEHFKKYNNDKLNSIIKSLGMILVSQRSDQVFNNLKSFEESLTEDDLYFIQEEREEYLNFANGPRLNFALEAFELANSSYYRNLNQIISDLTEILSEESMELLTDLFIRN